MSKFVFEFKEYKAYVRAQVNVGGRRAGRRSGLAKALGCQTSFVSQVLNGPGHFTLDQAALANVFLNHDREESHFFILLVSAARAGTNALREYYREQMKEILNRRSLIKNRVNVTRVIPAEHASRYYASWQYAAIHIALSIPELQTKDALRTYFRLPMRLVSETLEFLCATGLAEQRDGRFVIGQSFVHLGNDADQITKHHVNWRVRAMDALLQTKPTDLHYSVVYSVSKHDAERIRERLIGVIKANLDDVAPSKEEQLFCTCIDFFEAGGSAED